MQHKKLNKEDIERQFKKRLYIAVFSIVVLWLCNLCFPVDGTFGDKFGVINSLFSGLAFAGIIITIYMQKHELELQRKELKSTRRVFKRQVQLMTDQQNDNTFFNLLSNHRQLVDSFRKGREKPFGQWNNPTGSTTETVSGYEVIREIVKGWRNYLQNYSNSFNQKMILDLGKGTVDAIQILRSNSDTFTLYDEICHIYKFVNDRFPGPIQKEFYLSTFWKNLSFDEKVLFEIINTNFPERAANINFETEFYQKNNYINFHQCKLPEVKLQLNYLQHNIHAIHVSYDCELVECVFIIYAKNKERIMLIDKNNFMNMLDKNSDITFEELICRSNLGISSFPVEDSAKFNENNFACNYRLRKNDIEFDFLFGFDIHTNASRSEQDKTLYSVDIHKSLELSESDASKILELIKN